MIRLQGLSKSFGGKPALIGLDLEVERGEIFGLLGHNGAGKSTTFGIMLGQVYPDAGEAFIREISVQRDRSRALAGVGAIFETPGFYDYLSGRANLRIFTSYSGRIAASEMDEVIRLVGLEKRIDDPVRTYSHGMRQRLALAQALLPRPEVILLDEPTEGLDPEGIHEIRSLIQKLNREMGLTVLLSSHLLSEVEQMCHRVAILNSGRLIFCGKWETLASDGADYRLGVDDFEKASAVLAMPGVEIVEPGLIRLGPGVEIAGIVEGLVLKGVRVHQVELVRRSLEQIYLKMVHSK